MKPAGLDSDDRLGPTPVLLPNVLSTWFSISLAAIRRFVMAALVRFFLLMVGVVLG